MSDVRTHTRRARFHPLRVAEVRQLCPDAVAVTFDVPDELASEYEFRPGQSLTLRRTVAGEEQRRCYSVCAPAGGPLRIGVREQAGGTFSRWLVRQVRVGDEIEVLPPTGSFSPRSSDPARHVLIAAGSGITPILSIASSVLRDPATTATLIYGNRRADTAMFADELADLKDRWPERLSVVHVLSREPREVELFSGRLDAARIAGLLEAVVPVDDVDHWWLCGPAGMVADARGVLTEYGVPDGRVHAELFYVEDVPPAPTRHAEDTEEGASAGPSSTVTVLLDGRASAVTIPRATSLLDGARRVRPDVPFACKGGVCGTCRARVTRGQVELRRNFALEPDELDAGFVVTCQSYPTSAEVTVDYDA